MIIYFYKISSGENMEYKNLSTYFRNKYGKRLKKICIDGGFSCPNRDGTCGVGGCVFCGDEGAGEHIKKDVDIRGQVIRALEGALSDDGFVAYFQSFTNTYAPVSVLKERYDAALCDKRIRVLAIGTRPDCINEDIARLIASYKDRVDVWVELGLQTSNDSTASVINRGYKSEVFTQAVKILNKYGIDVVAHIIIGLPGESLSDIKNTVDFLNRHELFGLKIHSLYIMKNTQLEQMYQRGKYTPLSKEEYIDMAVYVLKSINPQTVIHRLTGDCPQDLLVAPEWNSDKHEIIDSIRKKLARG